jgi:hypothetical protein
VAVFQRVVKRLIIGSPVSTQRAGHTLLPKRLALPIFASDAMSSVAYATQEIMLVLTVAGTAYLFLAPWVALAVIVLMGVVVASYRQLVRVKKLRADRPRDLVNVYIPEYVVGHWWEQLLHNQVAVRLTTRLLYQPGVMVTSVPWQMESSGHAAQPGTQPTAAVAGKPSAPEEEHSAPAEQGVGAR